jgi:hypothetical protein
MDAGGERKPEMVTGVLSWLATDKEGNTIRVTSTYINDRADIDYEPSTSQPMLKSQIPATEIESDLGEIPVMTFQPSATLIPEEIPAVGPATSQFANTVQSAAPAEPTPPWGSYGVPWALLNMLRGKQLNKPREKEKVGQKGRVEEGNNDGTVIDDAYDREQLFELYKQLVKEYGPSLMFPNVNEQEVLIPLANGEIATGTLQTSAGTSFVVGSQTVGVGGPAATVKGEVVSLAPQGLVVGNKLIPIQAVAPVNPTNYAAVVTFEDSSPLTIIKPADNPAIMTFGSATLTAGGAAMVTAGHSILYNDHGEVVVDGTQTIDPTPIRVGAGASPASGAGNNAGGSGGQGGQGGGQGAGQSGGQGAAMGGSQQNDAAQGEQPGQKPHAAITMNGIVMDGGAINKNKAPATSMAMEQGSSQSGVTSFKTITSDGTVKTVPATAIPQAKPSASQVAAAAVRAVESNGIWMALGSALVAFVVGVFAL